MIRVLAKIAIVASCLWLAQLSILFALPPSKNPLLPLMTAPDVLPSAVRPIPFVHAFHGTALDRKIICRPQMSLPCFDRIRERSLWRTDVWRRRGHVTKGYVANCAVSLLQSLPLLLHNIIPSSLPFAIPNDGFLPSPRPHSEPDYWHQMPPRRRRRQSGVPSSPPPVS